MTENHIHSLSHVWPYSESQEEKSTILALGDSPSDPICTACICIVVQPSALPRVLRRGCAVRWIKFTCSAVDLPLLPLAVFTGPPGSIFPFLSYVFIHSRPPLIIISSRLLNQGVSPTAPFGKLSHFFSNFTKFWKLLSILSSMFIYHYIHLTNGLCREEMPYHIMFKCTYPAHKFAITSASHVNWYFELSCRPSGILNILY